MIERQGKICHRKTTRGEKFYAGEQRQELHLTSLQRLQKQEKRK